MSPAVADFDVRQALLNAARGELVEHGRAAVSLRAVARRAGVSHAAPKHHFGDRSGLLTAVAAQGFHALADVLEHAPASGRAESLSALGQLYCAFSQDHPALFELMFQTGDLDATDSGLVTAQQRAIDALIAATGAPDRSDRPDHSPGPSSLTLISWALAHGLAVLTRDGALQAATAKHESAEVNTLLQLYSDSIDVERLSRM